MVDRFAMDDDRLHGRLRLDSPAAGDLAGDRLSQQRLPLLGGATAQQAAERPISLQSTDKLPNGTLDMPSGSLAGFGPVHTIAE